METEIENNWKKLNIVAYGSLRYIFIMYIAEYPRTVIAKCDDCTIAAATIAVPLILTLNSVLTTSDRAADRFIKKKLYRIDRVRARAPIAGGGRRGSG